MNNNDTVKEGRTIEEIRRELELKRVEHLRKKEETKLKKQKYLEENKDKFVLCKACGVEYHISEYTLIFRRKHQNPELQCKACKREKNKKRMMEKTTERGY